MSPKRLSHARHAHVLNVFPTSVTRVAQISGCLPKKLSHARHAHSLNVPPNYVRISGSSDFRMSPEKVIPCKTCTFPQCFPYIHNLGSSDCRMSHKKYPMHNMHICSMFPLHPFFGLPRFQDVSRNIIPCTTCTFPQCFPSVHNLGSSDFRMSPRKVSHARHARFLNVPPNYVRNLGSSDFRMSPKTVIPCKTCTFPQCSPTSIIWVAQIPGCLTKNIPCTTCTFAQCSLYVDFSGCPDFRMSPKKLIPCKTCTFPQCFPSVHNLGSSDFRMSPKKRSHARHARFLYCSSYVRNSGSSDFRMSPKKISHARHAHFLNVSPTSVVLVVQISGCPPKRNIPWKTHTFPQCSLLRAYFS